MSCARNATAIPHAIQEALFCWRSELTMCERITTLGMALDVVTHTYFLCMAHFARTSDVRLRFVDAPTQYMLAPVYFCDRVLHASLTAVVDLRRQIASLLARLAEELRVCANFRKSTERSRLEVAQRRAPGDRALVLKWSNRFVQHSLSNHTRLYRRTVPMN